MPPSEFGPRRPVDVFLSETTSTSTESHAPSDECELLERVLRETLASERQSEPMEPAQYAAISSVAARHRGHPLSADPIGVELVEAVMRFEMPGHWTASANWRAMTAQVAATVFEDPRLRARLESLWNRLSQGLP